MKQVFLYLYSYNSFLISENKSLSDSFVTERHSVWNLNVVYFIQSKKAYQKGVSKEKS